MNGKLYIKEDITDWRDETLASETLVTSEQDILEALERGETTPRLARAAIVSRELNEAPGDIIRPNKSLLMAGAQMDVIQITKKYKEKVRVNSGAEYSVPKYIGNVPVKEDGNGNGEVSEEQAEEARRTARDENEPSFVTISDDRALEMAVRYLESYVPGYIWNRLLEIHRTGGDVRNEADKLKAKIDEMVSMILD